jgi:hypothetical protein
MKNRILKLGLSTLIGSFFYLIIGFLIFDLGLGSYTEIHTTQIVGFKKTEDFSFLFLYLSCLAYSILINFLLHNSRITSLLKAFTFSAIVGVLVACMTDFFWYASSYFYSNFTVILLDIFGASITVGALGCLSYYIQNKLKNS